MKKIILAVILVVAVTVGLIFAYKEMSRERALEADAEKAVVAESRVRRGSGGEVIVTLEAETQKRLGLNVAAVAAASLPREIKAYGRVLDPAPLAALLADIASAQTALDLSQRELRRLKTLFAQDQNTSRRSLEAAETAAQRDQIAAEAAHLKLVAAWGSAVAEQPDFPAFVKLLVAQQTALVRLDLPAGETAGTPQGARLFALPPSEKPIEARFLGPAADVDSQAQGQGFLFLVKGSDTGLRPGQALIGFIQQPGEPLNGVVVPPSAVIRAAGKAWVYLQTSESSFTRRDFALDHPTDGGWLVTSGLSVKDRIVVTGAQLLFSEELKSRIQVGE